MKVHFNDHKDHITPQVGGTSTHFKLEKNTGNWFQRTWRRLTGQTTTIKGTGKKVYRVLKRSLGKFLAARTLRTHNPSDRASSAAYKAFRALATKRKAALVCQYASKAKEFKANGIGITHNVFHDYMKLFIVVNGVQPKVYVNNHPSEREANSTGYWKGVFRESLFDAGKEGRTRALSVNSTASDISAYSSDDFPPPYGGFDARTPTTSFSSVSTQGDDSE